MTVSEIRKKGNNVKVLLSNGDELSIPYDVYQKNYFSPGDSITETQRSELLTDSEKYLIRQNSFRYLSGRNHSRFELKLKLAKKKYDKMLIENVLTNLTEEGFLDDRLFAEEYIKSKLNRNIGPLKIKSELFKKGIDREILNAVFADSFDEDIAYEKALIAAEKRYSNLKGRTIDDKKIKLKLYSFLTSKGFTAEIIKSVLEKLELSDE
jgi:regulatory protein